MTGRQKGCLEFCACPEKLTLHIAQRHLARLELAKFSAVCLAWKEPCTLDEGSFARLACRCFIFTVPMPSLRHMLYALRDPLLALEFQREECQWLVGALRHAPPLPLVSLRGEIEEVDEIERERH